MLYFIEQDARKTAAFSGQASSKVNVSVYASNLKETALKKTRGTKRTYSPYGKTPNAIRDAIRNAGVPAWSQFRL